MHQLEQITSKKSLSWRSPPTPYLLAVGYIEYILWEHTGSLPLEVEVDIPPNDLLKLVGNYQNAGYEVEFVEVRPQRFHITLG